MDDTNYSVTVAEIVPLRESENQVKAVHRDSLLAREYSIFVKAREML